MRGSFLGLASSSSSSSSSCSTNGWNDILLRLPFLAAVDADAVAIGVAFLFPSFADAFPVSPYSSSSRLSAPPAPALVPFPPLQFLHAVRHSPYHPLPFLFHPLPPYLPSRLAQARYPRQSSPSPSALFPQLRSQIVRPNPALPPPSPSHSLSPSPSWSSSRSPPLHPPLLPPPSQQPPSPSPPSLAPHPFPNRPQGTTSKPQSSGRSALRRLPAHAASPPLPLYPSPFPCPSAPFPPRRPQAVA
ncbi:hypothetical protein BC938DRAFT_482352 [Jimgerdemannia flammicorona]|uniref:Uncharacterized protein n=1 Tax=Jimgerdemannia flammicorona TaxID=994334 RepID=A0A433QE60_9FUNG|nr:hypothetical protein BC938DRAFT_482352 [Jimgerdemannia flammicorona]